MSGEIIHLVPHTHWDREWYEPFQRFRLRLVDLLDDVISRAEADESFHFTLDGQLAAVDDYLEVRPEAAARIAALVERGQFAIGPWAILLDEFLCSGENIVRNLEWGLRRAAELGGAMSVGYLPDMFGHCAQMPQILVGAGLRQACVWRGVPASVDRHAFRWQAPDGTGVRTEYLPGGYGNAAEMIAAPERLGTAAEEHLVRMRPWYGGDPVLAMYGTDHSAPLPWVSEAVRELTGEVRLKLSTLDAYLAMFDPDDVAGLPVCRGELRSHARANILPGVISNRPHLKRALSHAERMVERYAEPLAALWSPAAAWPSRLLELAWQRLIQSSCHDSVTGCGVDETAQQVAARIAEAEQIGRGIRDRTLAGIAASAPADGAVVVNPTPRPRTGIVRLPVVAPPHWPAVALRLPNGTEVPTQEETRSPDVPLYRTDRPAGALAAGLRKGSLGLEFLGRAVRDVRITAARELTVDVGRVGDGFTAEHRALADRLDETGGDWRLRVVDEPTREVYARVPVPALGHVTAVPVPAAGPTPVPGAVRVGPRSLANDLLTVEVAEDGTLTLTAADGTAVTGVGRIVDGGDVGDLYNYGPPEDDRLIDAPDEVTVRAGHGGPLVGSMEVRRRYPWRTSTEVVMRVEVRAGEPFCRLDVSFDNRDPDHRVRLHVPLPEPARRSHAEGQFAVVTRGLTSEGGHGEVPLPTFPAYSFVDAGGVAVLLDQVSEYELVDDGRELALTLLRATGVISRADHPLRAEPAGPVIATPQAQCIGPVYTSLAVMPHAGDWATAAVPEAAEVFRCPLLAVGGTGRVDAGAPAHDDRPGERVGLVVDGAGVTMTSLRRRDPQWLELRLVAASDEPTTATFGPLVAACRADLLGRPGDELPVTDARATIALRPWEIATVRFRPLTSDGAPGRRP
ncbi:MAG TPA: hypothetical protein VF054_20540 [Micromonosporaceae bacterium]